MYTKLVVYKCSGQQKQMPFLSRKLGSNPSLYINKLEWLELKTFGARASKQSFSLIPYHWLGFYIHVIRIGLLSSIRFFVNCL